MKNSFVRKMAALPAAALMLAAAASACLAQAIEIGDINSYSTQAAFAIPYRNGLTLAVNDINAAGGILGRQIKLTTRDDGGKIEDAVRAANELVFVNKVVVLTGTFASNVGLAVSEFAKQQKLPFVAAEALSDALTWQRGHRYAFRIRSSTYMQAAMLAEQAAKLPAKRWAIVAPNYEFGQSASESFKKLLKEKKPDVEFVAEQLTPLMRIDAGPVSEQLANAAPDGIFSALFGPDLAKFVREGTTRDLFKGKSVMGVMTGQPEFLDPLRAEAPVGWIVTGYPWDLIDRPSHKAFVAAYQKAFNDYPRAGSLSGYVTMKMVAAAITKASTTDPEKIVDALEGLAIESPLGPIVMRAADHQSTLGMYVGKIALKDGKGVMEDFFYADGANYLPSAEAVKTLRPAQ